MRYRACTAASVASSAMRAAPEDTSIRWLDLSRAGTGATMMIEALRRLEEICELGCLPKDLDQGLVDFPTRIPQ